MEQNVTINDRWVYRWTGDEPLEIGDQVLLPSSGWDEWVGTVTKLGGDYPGVIRSVLRRYP